MSWRYGINKVIGVSHIGWSVRSFLVALVVVALCGVVSGVPLKEQRLYTVITIAGNGKKGLVDGSASEASFNWPTGVVVAKDGTLFVADFFNNAIRRVSVDGVVTTVAGTMMAGHRDGRATDALFHGPDNIAIDDEQNIYIADADNYRIRRLSAEGRVVTIAGSGRAGYRDGSSGVAMFGYPTGIAVDGKGFLYVADRRTHTVRKITPDGRVYTIAGNGMPGFADGRGRMSLLREPVSVAVTKDGTLYIADSGNNAIRRVSPDGTVKTIAGGGRPGYRDGRGFEARFNWPTGIAIGPDGNIYVCDSGNNKIRRVTPDGVVSTVAGSIVSGRRDGSAHKAEFSFPTGIALDSEGNIYIADSGNNLIRKIVIKRRLYR